jgi:hypothetical protein
MRLADTLDHKCEIVTGKRYMGDGEWDDDPTAVGLDVTAICEHDEPATMWIPLVDDYTDHLADIACLVLMAVGMMDCPVEHADKVPA